MVVHDLVQRLQAGPLGWAGEVGGAQVMGERAATQRARSPTSASALCASWRTSQSTPRLAMSKAIALYSAKRKTRRRARQRPSRRSRTRYRSCKGLP